MTIEERRKFDEQTEHREYIKTLQDREILEEILYMLWEANQRR